MNSLSKSSWKGQGQQTLNIFTLFRSPIWRMEEQEEEEVGQNEAYGQFMVVWCLHRVMIEISSSALVRDIRWRPLCGCPREAQYLWLLAACIWKINWMLVLCIVSIYCFPHPWSWSCRGSVFFRRLPSHFPLWIFGAWMCTHVPNCSICTSSVSTCLPPSWSIITA